VEGKAGALYKRFYLGMEAELGDIGADTLLSGPELVMDQAVILEEVQEIVCKVRPDKRLGADKIPNRFLQEMGELLAKALQSLITAVFRTSHYPTRFRVARTIILRKLGKLDYSDLEA
jgi:hypothetical protein